MNDMKLITVNGRTHILRPNYRDHTVHPQANYMGFNMALAGVLRHGEDLEAWKKRMEEYRKKLYKAFDSKKAWQEYAQ